MRAFQQSDNSELDKPSEPIQTAIELELDQLGRSETFDGPAVFEEIRELSKARRRAIEGKQHSNGSGGA